LYFTHSSRFIGEMANNAACSWIPDLMSSKTEMRDRVYLWDTVCGNIKHAQPKLIADWIPT